MAKIEMTGFDFDRRAETRRGKGKNEKREKKTEEKRSGLFKGIEVAGVKFKETGKTYYYDPCGLKINKGDTVIVETSRGIDWGIVEVPNKTMQMDETSVLKKIVRKTTEADTRTYATNKKREKEAFPLFEEKVAKHKLEMKLIDVDLTFDHSKIIFYFTADGRVDFRELVKELAAIFRMRIELRQIGVRDEARLLNGMGICGRPLCCAAFLEDFQPVSIKMAKDQGLSLNPAKISGVCGRLLCCLKYEQEVYEELNVGMPNQGDYVRTPDGDGTVLTTNVLRRTVRVGVMSENDVKNTIYAVEEIKVLRVNPNFGRDEATDNAELKEIQK